MIISSTKNKKPKGIDNIQRIIDQGEGLFKSIYKNLQNKFRDELVSQLISRLFTTLEKQKQQIEEYKQEITSLKNNLVYLLKRILLSKNEEKKNISNLNKRQNYNKLLRNYSMTTNYTTIYSSFSPKNQSSSNLKLFTCSPNKTEIIKDNNFTNTKSFYFNKPQTELDYKINNYISSLYRHNFSPNNTNINNYFSLNKIDNIYDEISQKIRKNSKNKSLCSYNSYNNPKNKYSSSLKERYYNKLNKTKSLSQVNLNITDDNYVYINSSNINSLNYKNLKVKKKNPEKNINNKRRINDNKSPKNFSQTLIVKDNNKKNNINLKRNKMNKTNYYVPLKRSPFLVNKV